MTKTPGQIAYEAYRVAMCDLHSWPRLAFSGWQNQARETQEAWERAADAVHEYDVEKTARAQARLDSLTLEDLRTVVGWVDGRPRSWLESDFALLDRLRRLSEPTTDLAPFMDLD